MLIREEPPGTVRAASLAKFTADEARVVSLEVRRLEKNDLVMWGGTTEAKGTRGRFDYDQFLTD